MLSPGAAELSLVRKLVGLEVASVALGTSATARIAMPRCQDALLEMYIAHSDLLGDRTPYYGVLWPSAIGLAQTVGQHVSPGDSVVELGSGLGLAGIAAALTASPSQVLLTDHDPAAVRLGRLSARLSGLTRVVRTAALDWNTFDQWPTHFDVAIAADIIYEREACVPVAALLSHILRPGGRFVIADGERRLHRALLAEHLLADGAFSRLGKETVLEVGENAASSSAGDARDVHSNVVISVFEKT